MKVKTPRLIQYENSNFPFYQKAIDLVNTEFNRKQEELADVSWRSKWDLLKSLCRYKVRRWMINKASWGIEPSLRPLFKMFGIFDVDNHPTIKGRRGCWYTPNSDDLYWKWRRNNDK